MKSKIKIAQKVIPIWFTEDQEKDLRRLAEIENISISALMRSIVGNNVKARIRQRLECAKRKAEKEQVVKIKVEKVAKPKTGKKPKTDKKLEMAKIKAKRLDYIKNYVEQNQPIGGYL